MTCLCFIVVVLAGGPYLAADDSNEVPAFVESFNQGGARTVALGGRPQLDRNDTQSHAIQDAPSETSDGQSSQFQDVGSPRTRLSVNWNGGGSLFYLDHRVRLPLWSPFIFEPESRYQSFGATLEFTWAMAQSFTGCKLRVSTLHYNATKRKTWFETYTAMDARTLDTSASEDADIGEGLLVELIDPHGITVFEAAPLPLL